MCHFILKGRLLHNNYVNRLFFLINTSNLGENTYHGHHFFFVGCVKPPPVSHRAEHSLQNSEPE